MACTEVDMELKGNRKKVNWRNKYIRVNKCLALQRIFVSRGTYIRAQNLNGLSQMRFLLSHYHTLEGITDRNS